MRWQSLHWVLSDPLTPNAIANHAPLAYSQQQSKSLSSPCFSTSNVCAALLQSGSNKSRARNHLANQHLMIYSTALRVCALYNDTITSGPDASSGALSSRVWMKRGKRSEQPRDSCRWPHAARCTGEIVRSAPRISHTSLGENHTSGRSPAPNKRLYLPNVVAQGHCARPPFASSMTQSVINALNQTHTICTHAPEVCGQAANACAANACAHLMTHS